jgi:hypothetical protein
MTATVVRAGQRVHASGTCYSLCCACGPDDRGQQSERPRAYAYLRAHLLVCASEVNRTKERLSAFATASGFELAGTFVEEDPRRSLLAFERFFQAVMRDQVRVVLLPSLLHLMVLGSPGRIQEYFEAATKARVISVQDSMPDDSAEVVS